ncbi:MAG: TatD family hydrolase [Oscillospiraceae bacterium]
MIKNIFDSHAHYDDEDFDEDRNKLLLNMADNGIEYILNASSDIVSSRNSVDLAEKCPFIFAAVGVHPQSAQTYSDEIEAELIELSKLKKVVAVGEIGLDYHYDDTNKIFQIIAFEKQLLLAEELDLPVIIHSRDATEDTLSLLKKYKPRGVVHCFSGSAETAAEIIKLGMYIGFTGVITFKNAKRAIEAAKIIPLDKLLVETDCPYMAPVPFRGELCNSTMLQSTLEKLAEIKEISPQDLANITNTNAKKLFKIF